ncbi:MAG: hypothetical protein C4324_04525 [Blastocatellia bacterium]|mgnify:CR=1 FL=1
MYRRSKFQAVLLEIRQEMAREADFDVDLFTEMIRNARFSRQAAEYSIADRLEAEAVESARELNDEID